MSGAFKATLWEMEDRDLPIVALVGRPNVGKSTLFNRLTRSRRAIIDPTPGMTRDRLYGTVHRDEGSYLLVDTGGIEDDPDKITQMIRDQTFQAIQEAEIIIFLIDGREGLTGGDREIAQALRALGKPMILLVNKMDGGEEQLFDTDVYRLGFQKMILGSAEHNRNMETLLRGIDQAMEGKWRIPRKKTEVETLRLAIIGRPNVGKSSLVNKLTREPRVMVSEVAGTTRDPIDSYLNYNKYPICLVDTAGIRKRGRIEGSQEHLSVMMAKRQVERAHVVALLVDASDPTAVQDAAIAGIADKAFRPVIVVVNKWDLVEDKDNKSVRDFEDKIRRRMKFLESSPFVFISAKTGQRVTRILDLALEVRSRMTVRVSTGELNRFVTQLNADMPHHRGKRMKILYMTQVETDPPTFYIAVNARYQLHFSQERFLINRIRERFDLQGIPVKLVIKNRENE